ncbi:MAG: 2-C-methyl-D-erythritol 4-phosphate cytidylyltransferase [Thermaceae bacterium]|nr:2-C-methyl-D-erythritol 4-phosphate cytidylyltransferase [Thermaceae bacterium]
MKVSVLLPAAGSGERLGRGPKAFLQVGGKTLLEWALQGFDWADERIVALPAGKALEEPGLRWVRGGSTRQQSVFNMLKIATGDMVLVHDVARPFVVREAVERLLEATRQTGAATLALPVADTLVENLHSDYGEVIPRERYRLVQTPQGFRRELLWKAHLAAQAASRQFSDDAQLVMALGHPVALVEGDRRMFKVTYPEDLELAAGLARMWPESQKPQAQD